MTKAAQREEGALDLRATAGVSGATAARFPYARRTVVAPIVLAVCLTVVPLAVLSSDRYWMQILVSASLTASACLGLAVVTGWTKLVSFSQGAIYGVGAYIAGILSIRIGLAQPIAILVAVVLGGALGALIALPALRVSGVYLGIATIGIQLLLTGAMSKGGKLTGGPLGLSGISPLSVFGFQPTSPTGIYIVTAVWMCLVVAVLAFLGRSTFGVQLRITGHSEPLARSLGIPTARVKVVGFAIASAIGAGSGSLYAHAYMTIDPASFGITTSAMMLIIVLLAGLHGKITAVLVSAYLMVLLPELLRGLADVRLIAYGAALMIIVLFAPSGLEGLWTKLRNAARHVTPRGRTQK